MAQAAPASEECPIAIDIDVADDEALIDRIYEAGIVPDLWPRLLDNLAERYRGVGTVLFVAGAGRTRWTSSPGFAEHVNAFIDTGWEARNIRPSRAKAKGIPGFLTERDVFTPEELACDPMYVEFLRPRGLGSELGTLIPVPTGDTLVLVVNRRFDIEPVPPEGVASANRLRPHLARAALFSARLGLERARAASDALSAIGLPAAVLAENGRTLIVNALFEGIMPTIAFETGGRVALADKAANALLMEAIAGLPHAHARPSVRSIPMRAGPGAPPAIAHLLPIRHAAHDIFFNAAAILLVTPMASVDVPHAGLLEGLFDLTPAEARTAREVGEGARSLAEIADALNLSPETIRTQLRSVFEKTGTTRQPELVKLLAGFPSIGSR